MIDLKDIYDGEVAFGANDQMLFAIAERLERIAELMDELSTVYADVHGYVLGRKVKD